MSKTRRLLANTLANVAAQVLAIAVAIATLPLMFEAFGRPAYGVFMLASSTVALMAVFDFGLGLTTIKQVALHVEREDHDELGKTATGIFALNAALGILVALALALVGLFAGRIFRVTGNQADLLRMMLWIQAATQIVIWPANAGRYVLAGYQRYTTIVRVTMSVTIANAAAILLVLGIGEGPLTLTALFASISIVSALVMLALAWKTLPKECHLGRIDRVGLQRLAVLGLPVFTIQVAAFVMRQQTDRIVLGVFAGAAAVALYEVAAKLGSLLAQMNELATSALLPYVARLEAAKELSEIQRTFLLGTRFIGLILVPVIVLLTVWAPQLIDVWMGAQLAEGLQSATLAARLLMLSQITLALYSVADSILISRERFNRWVPLAVSLAVLNLVLSVVLVGRFGIVGVALGTFLASLAEAPFYLRIVFAETGIGFRDWYRMTLAPALYVMAITLVLTLVLPEVFVLDTVPELAVSMAAVLGVVYVFAYSIVLSAGERARILGLVFKVEK